MTEHLIPPPEITNNPNPAPMSSRAVAAPTEHGIPLLSRPSWHERTQIVYINAARMDPQGYRSFYFPEYHILTPQWYSPVKPVEWEPRLGASAMEQARNLADTQGAPLMHNSPDGTNWITRTQRHYSPWRSLGENAASGYTDPLSVVNALLLDASGGVPAPDASPGDGHRRTIMSSLFHHCGTAYAEGINTAVGGRVTIQDFGLNDWPRPEPASPLVCGSHLIRGSEVQFVANWYGAIPSSAEVIIDGESHAMLEHLTGTFLRATPLSDKPRLYHFLFTDANGVEHRYPRQGEFCTLGEAGCTRNYWNLDLNADGEVSTEDIFAFMQAWFRGDKSTDVNEDGVLTTADVTEFVANWMRGKP